MVSVSGSSGMARQLAPPDVAAKLLSRDVDSFRVGAAAGLCFSVLIMGLAANYVARLIQRYHWINYVGLAVILYVAANMIYEGWVGGDHVLGLRKVLGLG